MLFNSMQYLVFFPLFLLGYFFVPAKMRYLWLLVTSYYFYMCWSPQYAVLIALSTVITYISGLLIQFAGDRIGDGTKARRYKKVVVAASFISNLGILGFFKYVPWIMDNLNHMFHASLTLPFSIVLPVGISFYTFQALGYTMDVYRGDIRAEKNLFRYALFVSFFPQLVAGPIERSGNLLTQIENLPEKKRIDVLAVRQGLCMMLWGYFLKLVITDRAAILVDHVFADCTQYGFVELSAAAVLFAFQIYCDFQGYSCIARGSAQVIGIHLMENFRQPYLSGSIRDFWRRWHISLTTWFTDYLYIPLGGNRKGLWRQLGNTMTVFFVSGLWHGASWHYVAWGVLHGIYQCAGIVRRSICSALLGHKSEENPRRERTSQKNWQTLSLGSKVLRILVTFILTDLAWIFFRAPSCGYALQYLKQMGTCFQKVSLSALGLFWYDWLILLLAIAVLLAADILHERGIRLREALYRQQWWVRWPVYLAAFWVIILFGIYGVEYDTGSFIYFQF